MVAINTTFGWTVQGPARIQSSWSGESSSLICVLRAGAEIEDDTAVSLQQFWDIEHLGIVDGQQDQGHSDLVDSFRKSIEFRDGRYHVNLPFTGDPSRCLQDNRVVALKRLQGLMKKLNRSPGLLKLRYDKAIRAYLVDGHAGKQSTN